MICALFTALHMSLAATPTQATKAYGVVVANNRGFESTLAPLSYADDDGARYHELFSLITERLDILAVLDEESQRLYPATTMVAKAPSREMLQRSLSEIFSQIKAANAAGARTIFYFIYIGHGSVGEDGEGSIHLIDARFTRGDLFREVIAKSPATTNHVIIDACNAYLLIAKRGDKADSIDAQLDAAVDVFLSKENLDRYPNTGVLLSTSKATEVHEWSRFQAGIFSHEVRSALIGGADVNGDSIVTYQETRAFLGAANGRVTDPRVRLEPFVRPPKLRSTEPLFDQSLVKKVQRVHVPSKIAGRYFLEDERGVRFADVNMGKGSDLQLLLLPGRSYYLRGRGQQRKIPAGAVATVEAGELNAERDPIAYRGAEEESFRRHLFAIPFSRSYFEGFTSMAAQKAPVTIVLNAPPLHPGQIASLGMGALSLGAIAAGVGFSLSAASTADAHRAYIGAAEGKERLRASANRKATTATVFFATAGTLAVGALVTWLLVD